MSESKLQARLRAGCGLVDVGGVGVEVVTVGTVTPVKQSTFNQNSITVQCTVSARFITSSEGRRLHKLNLNDNLSTAV